VLQCYSFGFGVGFYEAKTFDFDLPPFL